MSGSFLFVFARIRLDMYVCLYGCGYGYVWICTVILYGCLYGHVWICVDLYGFFWICTDLDMDLCGIVCNRMVFVVITL